jgi:chitinase
MRLSLRSALAVGAASALLVGGVSVLAGQHANAGPQLAAASAATSGGMKVAYYDQWSIYQNAYYLKNVDSIANNLDYLIYDFENIDPTNLTCFETTKATDPDPGGENDPNAGDGAEDSFADYQKSFGSDISVDGTADAYGMPIVGNFHQLQELKKKHPNLKVLLSLGGWTYSKYFSDAAASSASRQKFVSSCIDMFIKGNIPSQGGYGGPGTAAGIFDGFDIDWEYPGSSGGHLGNHYSAADTANFTALLAEFRSELDAQGQADGKSYALTAALPAGQDKISKVQTDQIGQYLTFGDVMTYDMHGGWEPNGPTNFADPLYQSPSDPSSAISPGSEKYASDNAIRAYTSGDSAYGIPGRFPANKINLGIPFYYRGWTGVSAGGNHGLYQSASGPATGAADSGNVPGVRMYKELSGIVDNPNDTFWDPASQSAWFYDGSNFWAGSSAQSIQARADYIHCNGLGGAMMFSLYDLDPGSTLFNDVVNDVNGSAGSCSAPPTTTTTPPPTTTTTTTTTTTPPSNGNPISNPGFESGALAPWTCDAGTATITSNSTHSGNYALTATPSGNSNAQCTQTVTVLPNTRYTLSAWVQGNYVYLGAGSTSNWLPSATGWTQLSTTFTTGATTSTTIFIHGWYGTGPITADDFTLTPS